MKVLISLILCASNLWASDISLELEQIHLSSSPLEISGFVRKGSNLYAVSDNAWDTWLYRLDFKAGHVEITKGDNIRALGGYWPYLIRTKLWGQAGDKAHWDIEGAASCGEDLFLINEQVRHVLKISDGSLEKLPLDFEEVFKAIGKPLAQIPANAGFEGIAIDCEKRTLFLAQERSPRSIIVVDLKKNKIVSHFNTSEKNNPHPDYADLYFDESTRHLYVLERNMRKILKIDPATQKVVAKASYELLTPDFRTAELYDTGEPFGLAEALSFTPEYILIGNDNNVNNFSAKAKKVFHFSGSNSTVLRFKRPKGF